METQQLQLNEKKNSPTPLVETGGAQSHIHFISALHYDSEEMTLKFSKIARKRVKK